VTRSRSSESKAFARAPLAAALFHSISVPNSTWSLVSRGTRRYEHRTHTCTRRSRDRNVEREPERRTRPNRVNRRSTAVASNRNAKCVHATPQSVDTWNMIWRIVWYSSSCPPCESVCPEGLAYAGRSSCAASELPARSVDRTLSTLPYPSVPCCLQHRNPSKAHRKKIANKKATTLSTKSAQPTRKPHVCAIRRPAPRRIHALTRLRTRDYVCMCSLGWCRAV
jgi:hypothetical protein